jgi:NAD(P)-dependent dehydrogenase (short-subunit alcohol dehydrogenase family)
LNAATRAVLVTGASTGIGFDAALRLADRGFIVYAGVRNDAAAASLSAYGERVRTLRLDVTDDAQIAAAVETVAGGGCGLAAVIGNAGIAVGGPLEYLPVAELRRQFDVNVFGALAVAQAFLPQLRASRGRLVFVGSVSGRLAVPFIAPYSASKFALRALTDALRIELRRAGIAVALIEPGSVRTPIWAKGRASRERLLGMLPPQGLERYERALEAMFAQTMAEERGGMPVERVTRAIVEAVTAERPRANYVVGWRARAGSLAALLPARWRDRLFAG